MKALTFPRGVHPHDSKEFSADEKIEYILPRVNCEMVFPMSQHLGAPCTPIVSVGDRVLLGQMIGEPNGFVSSPIHSSVSGEVIKIEPRLTPGGSMVNSVVIKNDGLLETHPDVDGHVDYTKLSKEEILEIVKKAGVVGLGGAGFPTFIKLNPPADKKIDHILVNAAECEPFLTTDYRVLLEETDVIIDGLKIVLKLFPEAKGCICIETNKMDAIVLIEDKVKTIPNIEVVRLEPKYPQGAEKQLINAVTGREVPSGGLPADIGCIVNNVDTIIAIHRAVIRNRPLMRKVVTLTGDMINKPGNYKIRLGTPLNEILEDVGGLKGEPAKIVAGGPMMGLTTYSVDIPICKTSSAFIFMSEEMAYIPPEKNCIRCGKCVDHCPIGLMPLDLNYHVIKDDLESFESINGLDCIECGSCSFVCPSKRHLAQSIRYARRTVMANKRK